MVRFSMGLWNNHSEMYRHADLTHGCDGKSQFLSLFIFCGKVERKNAAKLDAKITMTFPAAITDTDRITSYMVMKTNV